ncbi:MAG: glycolate oxidase subunit GlcE [Burkholderiaceae bacterium]
MEQTLKDLQDRIVAAASAKTPLTIRGSGTKDWYGRAQQGEVLDVLDTRGHAGIVDYEPTELVITARCGTPLAEIEAALAEQRQMLPFEPPHFGDGATIGGVVAAGLSGPRRQAAGSVRDFVLGAVLVDGRGDVLQFGGQVMKNVAGYDVSRLLAGSLGTLGLIAEVSLKVLPLPAAQVTLAFDASQEDAIGMLNRWGGEALPISASAWLDGVLALRLSGARAAVDAATKKLGGEAMADGDALWAALREQTHPFFTDGNASLSPLWRLSVPSVAPPLALDGAPLIEWGGAQRWLRSDADAPAIRAAAARAGGHATLFRGDARAKEAGVFQPLAGAVAKIHRNLKNTFDPAGIFNPGRMYPEF